MNTPRDPWQRQPGESSKAYSRFCRYRDMGEGRSLRSLKRMCDESGTPIGFSQLARWSTKWQWQARAEAHDDLLAEERRLANVKAVREMDERHAKIAQAVQGQLVATLNRLTAKGETFAMTAAGFAQLLNVATALEARALGSITERVGVEHSGEIKTERGIDLSKLSTETLERMLKELGADRDEEPEDPNADDE